MTPTLNEIYELHVREAAYYFSLCDDQMCWYYLLVAEMYRNCDWEPK